MSVVGRPMTGRPPGRGAGHPATNREISLLNETPILARLFSGLIKTPYRIDRLRGRL